MGCKESFITMKLIWHGYLIPSLGIYVHETHTETDLRVLRPESSFLHLAAKVNYLRVGGRL